MGVGKGDAAEQPRQEIPEAHDNSRVKRGRALAKPCQTHVLALEAGDYESGKWVEGGRADFIARTEVVHQAAGQPCRLGTRCLSQSRIAVRRPKSNGLGEE